MVRLRTFQARGLFQSVVEQNAQTFHIERLYAFVVQSLAKRRFRDRNPEGADELETGAEEVEATQLWVVDGLGDEEYWFSLLGVAPGDRGIIRDAFAAYEEFLVRGMARVGQLIVFFGWKWWAKVSRCALEG